MEKRGWVFFDIDGTLLYARGSGRAAFQQAFDEALGWNQSVEHINFSGATDLDVFRQICSARGQPASSAMELAFFERLGPALDERLALNPPEVFPNVETILSRLSADWNLGIVTGNIQANARAKLAHAGLLDWFDPTGFGCGCDHEDRVQIARHALERAGNPRRVVLIGDTPKDVSAAKANGMTAIAVATGSFSVQALEETAADFVLKDLTDTPRILSFLEAL